MRLFKTLMLYVFLDSECAYVCCVALRYFFTDQLFVSKEAASIAGRGGEAKKVLERSIVYIYHMLLDNVG